MFAYIVCVCVFDDRVLRFESQFLFRLPILWVQFTSRWPLYSFLECQKKTIYIQKYLAVVRHAKRIHLARLKILNDIQAVRTLATSSSPTCKCIPGKDFEIRSAGYISKTWQLQLFPLSVEGFVAAFTFSVVLSGLCCIWDKLHSFESLLPRRVKCCFIFSKNYLKQAINVTY